MTTEDSVADAIRNYVRAEILLGNVTRDAKAHPNATALAELLPKAQSARDSAFSALKTALSLIAPPLARSYAIRRWF
jgi:hypothetical protein